MTDNPMPAPSVVAISSDQHLSYVHLQRAAERLVTLYGIDQRTGTVCDKRSELDALRVAVGNVRTAGDKSVVTGATNTCHPPTVVVQEDRS